MSNTPETDHLENELGQAARMSHPILWEQSRKLERERDEARNKMADALQEVDLRNLDFERMKQERDEAREVLREIAEASGFDNIGNWARNKANDALKNKN